MKQFLKKIKLFLKRVLDIKFSLKSLIIFILIFLGLLYLGKFLIEINIDIEKWIEKILNIINLGITCFLFFTTRSLYNYQRTTLKNENTPYPYIISVKGRFGTKEERNKIDRRKPMNNQKLPIVMWYYYGEQQERSLSEIEHMKGTLLSENNLEDQQIINEIKSNENSVCFSRINNENCIMFINQNIKESFIFEYCSAHIELKNYGALMNNFQLEGIIIYFNEENNNKIKKLKVRNKGQKSIPLIIQPNQEVSLIYCQVTNNLIDSQCLTKESDLEFLGTEYDGLQIRAINNILNYNKVEIIVSCENFLREKFWYKLIFGKEGYYYVSKTELLNENEILDFKK